jgi:hypothetical protein
LFELGTPSPLAVIGPAHRSEAGQIPWGVTVTGVDAVNGVKASAR